MIAYIITKVKNYLANFNLYTSTTPSISGAKKRLPDRGEVLGQHSSNSFWTDGLFVIKLDFKLEYFPENVYFLNG